jgi:hypothetical protein
MVRKKLKFNSSKQSYEKAKSSYDVVYEPGVNIYNSGHSILTKSESTDAVRVDARGN